jgi:hypothetical protein
MHTIHKHLNKMLSWTKLLDHSFVHVTFCHSAGEYLAVRDEVPDAALEGSLSQLRLWICCSNHIQCPALARENLRRRGVQHARVLENL